MNHEATLQVAIDKLPRVRLAERPTPIEPLLRLSAALGDAQLFIKRDDLTGLAFGGNKTRMLEFSLADALAKGADTVVTGMAVQSNYCRQAAAACAKLGLELHLVLRPVREIDKTQVQGNTLLQQLFGAHTEVMESDDRALQQATVVARAAELQAAGKQVYIPRQADTVDLDVIAYAEVALEIVTQCRKLDIAPRLLYSAAADTTQAGLVLGFRYLQSPIHVRGISPFEGGAERVEDMAVMATRAAQRLGLGLDFQPADFDNDVSYVGQRYGIPTAAGLAAIHTMAREEGILLDPVYTGKAMAALIHDIKAGKLPASDPILFLHTGGAPALFGYANELLASLPA